MSDATPVRTRQRGWWIPYTFVLGFAVVLGANGAMVYFATSTFSGLSTKQAYLEGLAYNDRVAEEQAQAALGWSLSVSMTGSAVRPDGTAAGTLHLSGTDADGRPLDGVRITADIRRPAEQGFDQVVTLQPVGAGEYAAPVVLPKPGQWDVLLTAERGGDTFRLRRRLLVD